MGKVARPERGEFGSGDSAGLGGGLVLLEGYRFAVLERQYVGAALVVVALELHHAESVGGQRGLERGQAAVLGGFPRGLQCFLAFLGLAGFGVQRDQFLYVLYERVQVFLEGLSLAGLEVQGQGRERRLEAVHVGDVAEFQLLGGVGRQGVHDGGATSGAGRAGDEDVVTLGPYRRAYGQRLEGARLAYDGIAPGAAVESGG